MASSLSRQTRTINIIPILSHIKRKKIPPTLMKKIKSQMKLCEERYNHTVTLTDWKYKMKHKRNTFDDEYNMDDKSVNEASNYNALIVGSDNYHQQYPQIAYQNLMNIYRTIHRRMQNKQWDMPLSVQYQPTFNILTPIHFKDQLPIDITAKQSKKRQKHNNILPLILKQSETPVSLSHLKDGSNRNNIPYFTDNDGGIEILIYRDIAFNIRSKHRIQNVIKHFDPDSIILECNIQQLSEKRLSQTHFLRNAIRYIKKDHNIRDVYGAASAVRNVLISNNNNKKPHVIGGNLCEDYYELLYNYAYLCDLFSLSTIEMSPILENKILPKKISTKSTKLLRANTKLSSEMRYMISPYFFPHCHLLGQITNSYLMHCLYGTINELKSSKILMIVNDDNVCDLMMKLRSNEANGYYFKYSFNALFKQIDDEFVTMPSALPSTYLRNESIKLNEFEWKTLHSMFGIKFVQFLEHEIEMKHALVAK